MTSGHYKITPEAYLSLTLVKAAFGEVPDNVPFDGLTGREWADIYAFSLRQGILPIVYDGLMSLPAHLRPPAGMILTWGVNTEISAERYHKRTAVTASLARFFAGHGIRMLVMKGYGLSLCYPLPEHRECGDIDIYLFGDFEKGNELIRSRGIEILPETEKHNLFVSGGISVENHYYMVNADRNRRMRRVEEVLGKLSRNEARKVQVDGAEVWLPSSTANAIHLLAHAASHFAEGELSVRAVCDWARFFCTEGENIDRELFEDTVRRARLDTLCNLMTAFSEDCLGLAPQGLPEPPAPLRAKFDEQIMGYTRPGEAARETFFEKVRRVWADRWRSRVLAETFASRVLFIVKRKLHKAWIGFRLSSPRLGIAGEQSLLSSAASVPHFRSE